MIAIAIKNPSQLRVGDYIRRKWTNDLYVVIARQVFADGGVRALLSIPKACILERYDLMIQPDPDAVQTAL